MSFFSVDIRHQTFFANFNMTNLIPALGLSLLFFLASADANAQTVSGSIGNGRVSRGSTARGSVVINIPKGLHVNSNNPNSQYAIPTTVRLSGSSLRFGSPRYPRGHDRKFVFSESSINVYEGRVPVTFSVNVPANFRGNSIRVTATVRYQACTEEVCYPPRTKQVTLTARVR